MEPPTPLLHIRQRSAPLPAWLGPLANVDEVPLDGRGGGHLRRDEVRPAAASLTALEVSVGRGGAALARLQDVGVHAQAHRAAGHAPVETGLAEYLVQALVLGLF